MQEEHLSRIHKILKTQLDWGYVLKKSKQEAVACLIYHHLQKCLLEKYLPSGILEQFRLLYYSNSVRNTLIAKEVKGLLNAFNQNKTGVILLRGIYLAEVIYQNIALRPMADIDLLVKKDDLLNACKLLEYIGYARIARADDILKSGLAYSLTFRKKDPSSGIIFLVDLHWNILTSTWMMSLLSEGLDMQKVWSEARTKQLADTPALVLSCRYNLIHLCLHAFSHSFNRLIILTDIVESIRYYQDKLNADEIVSEAREQGVSDILSYTLYYAFRRIDSGSLREIKALIFKNHTHSNKLLYFMQRSLNFHGLPCLIYILMQDNIFRAIRYIIRIILLMRKILLTH